jgi:acyl-CoA hydrolase
MSLDYVDEYIQKLSFAHEVVKLVKSGDRVVYGFGVCKSNELDRYLAMRKDELSSVRIICNDMSCDYFAREADPDKKHFQFYEGLCAGLREISMYEGGSKNRVAQTKDSGNIKLSGIKNKTLPNYIFMATVSPMNKDGYFWFGKGAPERRIFKKYYEVCKYVILEINERIVEGQSDECIHISDVDYIVGSQNAELLTVNSLAERGYSADKTRKTAG